MALTAAQRAAIRLRLGWSARFHQFDSRLEQAMSAIDTEPDHEAQIVALLASMVDIDTKLVAAHDRLKADQVGSITLNRGELRQLSREGRRFVTRLASILGVEVRANTFGSSPVRTFAGFGGTYVGK